MLISIDDPQDPRIADYIGIRDAHAREQHLTLSDPAPGTFVAEGELVVRQLAASGFKMKSVLLTRARLETARDLFDRVEAPVFVVEQGVMNGIAGFNIHRGILAVGERPAPPPLPELLREARTLVILEDLSNHDNIGGIFRATAALGASPAVLLSPRCADPLYRKAVRVSMGTVFHVPFARLDRWPDALGGIRQAGFRLIGLTPAAGSVAAEELPRGGRTGLLLGAEGPGLTEGALAAVDCRVRIPINAGVDSLNVVTAAAVALHRLSEPVTGT